MGRRSQKKSLVISHWLLVIGYWSSVARYFCLLPFAFCLLSCRPSIALPPPEDLPEEVLRTQIITEARSPIDGKPLTAAEYAELKAQLAESPFAPEVNQKLRDLIVLLRLRQLFKTFTPF
jgi:hypothetical protein